MPSDEPGPRLRDAFAGTWTGVWKSEFGTGREGRLVLEVVQGPTAEAHVDALVGAAGIDGRQLLVTGTVRRAGGRVCVRAESDRGARPWLSIDAVFEPCAGGGDRCCRGEFFLAGEVGGAHEIGSLRLRGA